LAKVNVEGIVTALMKTDSKVDHRILPNLNHMFQNAKSGSTDEYADIEETLDVAVLEMMNQWIKKQL
jgi:uncharacterized protein YijF (DUF1287 family)